MILSMLSNSRRGRPAAWARRARGAGRLAGRGRRRRHVHREAVGGPAERRDVVPAHRGGVHEGRRAVVGIPADRDAAGARGGRGRRRDDPGPARRGAGLGGPGGRPLARRRAHAGGGARRAGGGHPVPGRRGRAGHGGARRVRRERADRRGPRGQRRGRGPARLHGLADRCRTHRARHRSGRGHRGPGRGVRRDRQPAAAGGPRGRVRDPGAGLPVPEPAVHRAVHVAVRPGGSRAGGLPARGQRRAGAQRPEPGDPVHPRGGCRDGLLAAAGGPVSRGAALGRRAAPCDEPGDPGGDRADRRQRRDRDRRPAVPAAVRPGLQPVARAGRRDRDRVGVRGHDDAAAGAAHARRAPGALDLLAADAPGRRRTVPSAAPRAGRSWPTWRPGRACGVASPG